MKRVLLAALIVMALLVSLTGIVAAAPPADNPGKGPPEFAKAVFIHYAKDFAPARPARGSGSEADGYIYSGVHWPDREIPVDYLINLTNSPVADADALTGINTAFQTWENDPGSYIDFAYSGPTTAGMSGLGEDGYMDGLNVIGWANLGPPDPILGGIIAVTIYWYRISNLQLAEVDVAMNSNTFFSWSQNPPGESWTAGDASGYDVDVQNIMTHEAGHWLVLNDLYDAGLNSEKTMYGLAVEFELSSRSLHPADEAGINVIYPSTEEDPSGGEGDIEIFNFEFIERDFATESGAETVTWINRQGSHDITFMLNGEELLRSGNLSGGETYEVTKTQLAGLGFNVNEATPYHCHKHSRGNRVMAGTIFFVP